MTQTVRPVDPELLIKANERIFKERAKGDPIMTVIANFADTHDDEELLAVTYRLQALKNVVRHRRPLPWVLHAKGKSHRLVNEAMIRAAAKAPLTYEQQGRFADVVFDENELLRYTLAESPSLGEA